MIFNVTWKLFGEKGRWESVEIVPEGEIIPVLKGLGSKGSWRTPKLGSGAGAPSGWRVALFPAGCCVSSSRGGGGEGGGGLHSNYGLAFPGAALLSTAPGYLTPRSVALFALVKLNITVAARVRSHDQIRACWEDVNFASLGNSQLFIFRQQCRNATARLRRRNQVSSWRN